MDKAETQTDVTWYVPPNNSSTGTSSNDVNEVQNDENETERESRVPFNLSDMYYTMTGTKYLHIFNHYEYECDDPELAKKLKRDGTHEDVKSLKATFDALGFEVKEHHDLRHQDILTEMKKVWTMDHSTTSCVAVAILTHGRNGGFLLSKDRVMYPLSELTAMMDDAHPALEGKPKLWFIQACRSGHWDDPSEPEAEPNIRKPKQGDTLYLYSSSPHYYSYRCSLAGAWMMQSLCGILNLYHQTYDILQMLTFVNQVVSSKATTHLNPKYANKKQMPEIQETLQKLLKF